MGEWLSEAKRSSARGLLPSIMLVVLAIFLGIVAVKIVWMDTSVPVSSTDVEAAARTNERLLQVIQWALTTVLGLGLALIGINWFQSTRDRSEILELEKDLHASITEFEDRLAQLNKATDAIELKLKRQELRESIRLKQKASMLPSVVLFIDAFEGAPPGSLLQRAAAEEVIDVAERSNPNTVKGHQAMVAFLPILRAFDPTLALDLAEIITRDIIKAKALPPEERPVY